MGIVSKHVGNYPQLPRKRSGYAKSGIGYYKSYSFTANSAIAADQIFTCTSQLSSTPFIDIEAYAPKAMALILIVITGAELFTGNCLVAISFFARKISRKDLARNLIIDFCLIRVTYPESVFP